LRASRPSHIPAPRQSPPAPLRIEDLFRDHAAHVASLGLMVLGQRDEVDDLVQDVFLRAWRALRKLRQPELARPWLMTIAIRLARRRLQRRRLLRGRLPPPDLDYEQIAAPGISAEDRVLVQQLFRALEALPVDLKVAWVLRHWNGETVESIAALCRWSRSTTKRRINAAHERVLRRVGR
jgi:RNA polymerase sigma-70 factor (ECF subfamily)